MRRILPLVITSVSMLLATTALHAFTGINQDSRTKGNVESAINVIQKEITQENTFSFTDTNVNRAQYGSENLCAEYLKAMPFEKKYGQIFVGDSPLIRYGKQYLYSEKGYNAGNVVVDVTNLKIGHMAQYHIKDCKSECLPSATIKTDAKTKIQTTTTQYTCTSRIGIAYDIGPKIEKIESTNCESILGQKVILAGSCASGPYVPAKGFRAVM